MRFIFILTITLSSAGAQAAEVSLFDQIHNQVTRSAAIAGLYTAPKCASQSESCLDAWYSWGDATGDYGIVDAAN